MPELTDFLLARIADDRADAQQLDKDLDRWERETAANGTDGRSGSERQQPVHMKFVQRLVVVRFLKSTLPRKGRTSTGFTEYLTQAGLHRTSDAGSAKIPV